MATVYLGFSARIREIHASDEIVVSAQYISALRTGGRLTPVEEFVQQRHAGLLGAAAY
jgi:hypothetical protein